MTSRSLPRFLASAALLVTALAASVAWRAQDTAPRVLIFSKTAAYRHSSIEPGIAAIRKLGAENGFAVDVTEDATAFTEKNLQRYRAVIFLSTTGDVLNARQQDAFERYIEAGGGWVGIHSATDTEYDWPWYGQLAGAWFLNHPSDPNVQRGTYHVVDKNFPATATLPDSFSRDDEFYNFKSISPDIHVLIEIDESSYHGGSNGAHHPMSWYHEFDGGRAFYTNMGHVDSTFSEPLFLTHLLGGLRWAMATGGAPLDFSRARPEENRFTKVVLASKLNEPVELAVLPDERVLFVERRGPVNLYTPASHRYTKIATIPVSNRYADSSDAEDGLLGLAADPNFASNGWVYMYYSPAGPESKNVLARFTMKGDSLDLESKKIILEVATQRLKCCHTGGSIAFDGQGNLFVSTGDNSNPFATGYAPIDERPGRSPWDAQKSSGNTNDLRGKIIRIHPEPDGSYTIPPGNLFPPGTPRTRPEIYTMGHRNPYRIDVDKHTGWLYWGDVGPDASDDSVGRGPMGYDEFNQARRAGNYGWPYFIGDNKPYDHFVWLDSATIQPGAPFDPAHPTNTSPNNTGLNELPPAQKAYIWYPYGPSHEFPIVGTGGRAAVAGPVFYRDDFRNAARPFPAFYDRKLFIYEWMRGWIMAVTMDSSGDLANLQRFMPSTRFANPIDMQFAPSGDLYVLEYGTIWFSGNDDARLVRIEYTAGNRKPIVVASADKPAGATPLRVSLSSAGTNDLDDDSLHYAWTVRRNGAVVQRLTGANPTVTLSRAGVYMMTLVVTDAHGAKDSAHVHIAAGNEPPTVGIDLASNRSFFFPGVPVQYAARVSDREDGTLAGGRIPASQVLVTAEYLKDGAVSDGGTLSTGAAHQAGLRLIQASGDCLACHQIDRKSIGPAYTAVAHKYHGDSTAAARLSKKVRTGGTGVWGSVMMPAHPQLSETEAAEMVAYILSLADAKPTAASLPVRGSYVPPDSAMQGAVVLRAAYSDRGANGAPPASAEKSLLLRAPTLVVASGELAGNVQKYKGPEVPVEVTIGSRSGAYAGFKQLDLTGVSAIVFTAMAPTPQLNAAGGTLEVHADSATGPLLGQTAAIEPSATMGAPSQLKAALAPTSGMHDVYFVFRNPTAPQGQSLFVVMTATFVHAP